MRLFLNDKPSNIAEICSLLQIKQTIIPSTARVKSFKRLGIEGKRDPQTKKAIIPRGYGIPNSIDVYLSDGNSAKITYAENATTENIGGVAKVNYTPLSTMLPGLELSLKDDQKNLFFYLFIHTYNKQSPLNIGKPNPNVIYEFVDNEKAAREMESKEDELYEAITLLKGLGDKEIVQVAKGYKIEGIDQLSIAEVTRLLRAKIKSDPAQFILDMENNEVALEGIIKDAMDKGVISKRSTGTSTVWSIADKDLATTKDGSVPMAYIRAEIESDLEFYFPLLQKGVDANVKAAVLKTPNNAKFFADFKRKEDEGFSPLNTEEQKLIYQNKAEEMEADKMRKWYGVDVNDASVHALTRKAAINNAEKILAQFAKDKAEGLIPEDQPEPKVTVMETV